ncbi:hypothetical protein AURDEDRAFT_116027 [Auricularia subglabra TFB-10046 SS5]|nr:hypothetical protein AURDEDRAFT_116027 [Auricularia subglabra TFB-10046 SS5]
MLKAPRLKTLSISHKAHAVMIGPFLEAVKPTVSTLIIHNTLARDGLAPLSKLSNVEHLLFARATTIFKLTYSVSDDFFGGLAAPVHSNPGDESPNWIWPKLSTISLSDRGAFAAGTGQNFLQLVRARTGSKLDDRSTPRRLTSVVIEDTASPVWLRDEVKLMFA